MAYRNGTYVAFDGLSEHNPANSDFKHYAILKAWNANGNIDFKFINSHEKTAAVRDTSKRTTLEARIRERLANSKNMLVLLSDDTRKTGSMLSYEIEKAVDTYHLPLIVAYVNYMIVSQPRALSDCWPDALKSRIDNGNAKAIHIPFIKEAVLYGINQFNCEHLPSGTLLTFTESAQRSWNPALSPMTPFVNTRK